MFLNYISFHIYIYLFVAALEDSLVAVEDNDPEKWSSHYFPAPSASGGGRGGKKNGFKKVSLFVQKSLLNLSDTV